MKRRGKKGLHLLIFLGVFAGITAIVMLLWNALIPSIIGWSAISYWESAGLLVLCRLLLGGFGHWKNGGMMMGGGPPASGTPAQSVTRSTPGVYPATDAGLLRV